MGNVWVGVWARHREVDEGVGERVGGCISKGGSAEGEGNGEEACCIPDIPRCLLKLDL